MTDKLEEKWQDLDAVAAVQQHEMPA